MKKILIIVCILVVAGVTSFLVYQKLTEIKIASLESIMPDGAIYYLHSYNLDKKIKDFQASPFFKQVSELPFYVKYIEPEIEKAGRKMPFLPDLIKKDTAVAIFSFNSAKVGSPGAGDFIFLTKIDSANSLKIKRSIAEFYLSAVKKDNISYSRYKGIKITSYKIPDTEKAISYTIISDTVFVSSDTKLIIKSIDLAKKLTKDNLLNNAVFQKLTPRIKKDALIWIYADTKSYNQEMLRRYASDTLKSSQQKGSEFIQSVMKMQPFTNLMNAFEGYVSYVDYDDTKSGLIVKTYRSLNRQSGDRDLFNVIAYNKPLSKDMLRMVPRDIIFYYAYTADPLSLWRFSKNIFSSFSEMARARFENSPAGYRLKEELDKFSFENMLKAAESYLGIDLEKDFIPLLSDNAGLSLVNLEDASLSFLPPTGTGNAPATAPSMPIVFPQIYCYSEVKDSVAMQKVMQGVLRHLADTVNQQFQESRRKMQEMIKANNLQDKPEFKDIMKEEKTETLKLKSEDYNGVNITGLEISNFPLTVLQFNYCIIDKYLVFSLSTDLTKEIIDTYKNSGSNFGANIYFTSAQDKMPPEYTGLVFIDFKKMINNIKGTKFFNGLINAPALNPKTPALKSNIDSLFLILDNINAYTLTSKMLNPETIETTSYFEINGLN